MPGTGFGSSEKAETHYRQNRWVSNGDGGVPDGDGWVGDGDGWAGDGDG